MQEFTFQKSILGGSDTWAIKDGHLMRRGGEMALLLATVSRAEWGEFAYKGTRSAWLHLSGPDGAVKLECNDAGGTQNRQAFLSSVHAVCETLAQVNPALRIRQGGGAGYQWAMFLIGLVFGVFGLALLVSAVVGFERSNRMQSGLLGAGMAASLLYFAWIFAPWRPPETRSAIQMAAAIRAMMRPVNGPEDDAAQR